MIKKVVTLVFLLSFTFVFSQNTGVIKGKVIDASSRTSIPFANVVVFGTTIGISTDENGEFILKNVPLGYVKVTFSFLGYTTNVSDDYLVTNEKVPYILGELQQTSERLNEVVIGTSLLKKSVESPLSKQRLGIAEIEKNPGGNRDILKVIQSLPGVASNPGFRNDIIIRGGSPSENVFYIDGVEVPVINHFQTQGSTGGPVGIINADLIRNVNFYASAFPANEGNTLSSVIEFTQKDGSKNKLNARATLGTSDAGVTLDGPINSKTTFIASFRQSYLQFLFKLIKLPFLPTYNDFQFKVKHQISSKDEISIIGLGAIDNFKLNESVNNNVTDAQTIKRNNYILGNIPVTNTWNYTVGAVYKHYGNNSTQQFVLSRNVWNNTADKYADNIKDSANLLLKYNSTETENKLRYENTISLKRNFKLIVGAGLEQAQYANSTFQKFANSSGLNVVDFSSNLNLLKYNLFGQISKSNVLPKLDASVGFRLDAVNFSSSMKNPFNQFSPRISLSYELVKKWRLNATAGRYYELPAYTIIGFKDNNNNLVNKQNNVKYIQATHLVTGLEYKPEINSKITFEGFYKKYKNYPFSIKNQISLANLGSDFGVVGNEAVTSTSSGRAYGFEVFAQKTSYSGFYGILSYTFVKSEFKDKRNNYIPSTWDNRHLLTLTSGKKLKKNWEIGTKFRLVGGQPYTPYDLNASEIVANYDVENKGILNYNLLNTKRFKTYTQLDIRVDKTWYWKRFSLNFYIDLQNVYNAVAESQGYLIPETDANGNRIVTNNAGVNHYQLEEIANDSGNFIPRFGLIIDL